MRLPPVSIARVLDGALEDRPDHEAVVARSRRLSYRELDDEADHAATVLRSLGVRPGDRVAASLPNDVDLVIAFHGAMRAGAIWLGINRALAGPEKQFQLADAGTSLLLAETGAPDLGVASIDLDQWRAAVAAADRPSSTVDVDPHAPAAIAYTSGTTGRPKGAVHSQRGLLAPGAALVESRRYDHQLRKGDCFPFTIVNIVVLSTLLVAQAQGTSVVMDRIDAEGVAEWIRTEAITLWNGPPTLLHSLAAMDAVAASDLRSLGEVWTGGADCPEAIRAAFAAKFALPVWATYGLTEAPSVVTVDPVGGGHVAHASGRPLPHLEVQIRADDGQRVPTGETGEVCLGPAPGDDRYPLMLGYWGRPADTASSLAGGVLHTGDTGFVDGAGYLHLRDRRSLLIIRGGANVYPAEVERVLHDLPGVAAAVVFGIPDERLGERVAALVEPAPGADLDLEEIRTGCSAELARYKVPERMALVPTLPRNAMGKVVRTDLARLLDP